MIERFVSRYSNLILSSWIVTFIDILLLVLSILIANILRFDFVLAQLAVFHIFFQVLVVVIVGGFSLIITGTHRGIIRHTGQSDALRIIMAITLCFITIWTVNFVFLELREAGIIVLGPGWLVNQRIIPRSVILIFYPISIVFLLVFRLSIKLAFYRITNRKRSNKINILIYGAGKAGIMVKNTFSDDRGSSYFVAGFVDDNPGKIGKSLQGTKIYKVDEINNEFIEKQQIREIIIAIPSIGEQEKLAIYGKVLDLHVKITDVPPFDDWINGQLNVDQIKNLKIEDLLQRDPIHLGNESVLPSIVDKTVMVTGAAGSIGMELSRQLLYFSPRKVIFVDQAETPLFELEQELSALIARSEARKVEMEFIIADVSNSRSIMAIMSSAKPQFVYHAAAYKHVPLMEANPMEAIRVNVFGTSNTADAACESGVEKFIMVSTDKAVNPTSIMGASKRLAEIYVQSLNSKPGNNTAFITTRFGNVLGSNGSVTLTFRKQILAGGPVTVTHPEITRYFMTIPEACQLIFEAGAMGRGGEIFIFDMGKPVKILDLAESMIHLNGKKPGRDIEIKFTGLRPGEKLFEELLTDKELTQPTYNPKIMIGKVSEYDFDTVKVTIDNLITAYQQRDQKGVVMQLKMIIPEYISNNSVYGELDGKQEDSL